MPTQASFPILFVTDLERRPCGWVGLLGPLRTEDELAQFESLRPHFRVVGFTSYTTFPRVANPQMRSFYERACVGWCHGFRHPEEFLPAGSPRTLLSQSDFLDLTRYAPSTLPPEVDVVYVCGNGAWRESTKNWTLARKAIVQLASAGLSILVIGRRRHHLPALAGITISEFLPRAAFHERLARARCLFVPSILDASPRIICEALALNVPVLVHQHILGGWKYVNSRTGAFFRTLRDLNAGYELALAATGPRSWLMDNSGLEIAGRQLSTFLGEIEHRSIDGPLMLSSVCRWDAP